MELEHRVEAFVKLGDLLRSYVDENFDDRRLSSEDLEYKNQLSDKINLAKVKNPWFTHDNVNYALNECSKLLNYSIIKEFNEKYNFKIKKSKKVALITAGNIPLVGFHDFFCVLMSGHSVLIKPSSNDTVLLPFLAAYLMDIEPLFANLIEFTTEKLTDFDAVIATGSTNTSRYFDYYFKGYPSIIRKNRNSVAILTGDESHEDLELLSEDIFRYYGLGCRNVSKLFVPEGYNFDAFFKAIYKWHHLINEHKYANNYDYNKAVYLMSEYPILDNGFFVLKEDASMASPIATLNYEYYKDKDQVISWLNEYQDNIQCVVSKGFIENEVAFGETQKPKLSDFADGFDTVDFLLKI